MVAALIRSGLTGAALAVLLGLSAASAGAAEDSSAADLADRTFAVERIAAAFDTSAVTTLEPGGLEPVETFWLRAVYATEALASDIENLEPDSARDSMEGDLNELFSRLSGFEAPIDGDWTETWTRFRGDMDSALFQLTEQVDAAMAE